MKTFHSVFLGFLLLISCRSEAEQKSPSADKAILNQVLKQVFEKNELMGASVMLIADGNIAYQKYFGLADSVRQIAIAENTVYRVASISKTIAATALMQLWEQGKVDLDVEVDRYLGWPLQHPEFPDAPITLRLLMNHRSGIRDGKGYGAFSKDMIDKKLRLKDLFTPEGAYYTKDLFSDRPPGDYFSYANCTWGLVASVIEKVSGLRFDEYCKKNIFEPLGMRASFNVLDLPDLNQLAVLYRYRDGRWVPQADHYQGQKPAPRFFEGYELGQNGLIFGPQGGLRSSAKDLAAFALMLMNDGTWQGKSILEKESVDLMTANHWTFENGNGDTWENFFLPYGLGVHRLINRDSADIIFPDRKMLGHPGIAYGLLSDMYFDPETKSGVVFITNGGKKEYVYGEKTAFYQVEEEVFGVLYPFLKALENQQ